MAKGLKGMSEKDEAKKFGAGIKGMSEKAEQKKFGDGGAIRGKIDAPSKMAPAMNFAKKAKSKKGK